MNKWILLIFLLLCGCDPIEKIRGYSGNIKVVDNTICLYTKDAKPGDFYTVFLLDDNNRNSDKNLTPENKFEFKGKIPAWNNCLPGENIKQGISYDAFFALKKKNGLVKKYRLSFIWTKSGNIILEDIFDYKLNKKNVGVVNGSPFPDD